MNTKYENFFPHRVYQCACLLHAVNEIFNSGEKSLATILDCLYDLDFELSLLSNKIFCVRVEESKVRYIMVHKVYNCKVRLHM